MNNRDLLKAIGDIDDRYLNETNHLEENQNKSKIDVNMKKRILKYVLAPVCVIIIAVIGISKSNLFNLKNNTTNNIKEWKIKEVYIDGELENIDAIILKWEEMSISEQFNTVKYNNSEYFSKKTKIASNNIEKRIENSILTGYDVYTKRYYNTNAEVYSIKNISKTCAVAVKFEGDTDYYVYTNLFYQPKTLREFVENLQLEEIISFGTIYYDYWEENEQGNKEHQNIEFYNVDNKVIWQMLFDNLDLKNIYTDNGKYRSDKFSTNIEISVDIELLGYKNISIELTDKGYLITNILDSGKAFYIGEEKVQEFLDYIMKNYDGYKIVYVYKNDNETKNEDKKDNENLQIVTHNMIDNTDTYINLTPNTMIDMSIENRTQQNISNSI